MEIKDYLHFYIGCLCKVYYISENFQAFTGLRVGDEDVRISPQIYVLVNDNLIKVKPILRKLSDMTEEELKQTVASEWGTTHTFTEHYCKKKIAEMSKSSYGLFSFLAMYGTNQSLPYLLKQGFDLFNLIDAGLAIDNKSL